MALFAAAYDGFDTVYTDFDGKTHEVGGVADVDGCAQS